MTDQPICGFCREPLPENAVSEFWCSQGHQELWHRNRGEPLDKAALRKKYRGQHSYGIPWPPSP